MKRTEKKANIEAPKVDVEVDLLPFSFMSHRGDVADVKAKDEKSARYKAMVKIWGPPYGIYAQYNGTGLMLRTGRESYEERVQADN